MNLDQLIIAALVAGLVGIMYAFAVHAFYQHDPEHPYTALLVVFGVAGTLAVAAIIVPLVYIAIFAVLFAITGIPQIVGSMIRDSQRRRRMLQDTQRQIRETLPQ